MLQAPNLPLNYNRYTYCMNNPLLYTDPTGNKWYEPWTWSLKRGWDNVWKGLDNFAKWADRTDWFPSSGYVSTDINMHSYSTPYIPNDYDHGGTDYMASYSWATSPRRLESKMARLNTSYVTDVNLRRSPLKGTMDQIPSLGLDFGSPSLNVGLKDMQRVDPELYGYELLPTQQIRYSRQVTYNPQSNISITAGALIYITEKSSYFPKGSIESSVNSIGQKLGGNRGTYEMVGRYQIFYTT